MKWDELRAHLTTQIDEIRIKRSAALISVYPGVYAGWSLSAWWPGKKVSGTPTRAPCPYDFRVDVSAPSGRKLPSAAVSHVALLADFALLTKIADRDGRLFASVVRLVIERGEDALRLGRHVSDMVIGELPGPVCLAVWQLIGLQEEFNYPPPRYMGRLKPLSYLNKLVPPGADAGQIIYLAQSGTRPPA
jgi:hypothetical protein